MAKSYKWLNEDSNPYRRLIGVTERKSVEFQRITIGQKEEELEKARAKMQKAQKEVTRVEKEILEIKKALGVE